MAIDTTTTQGSPYWDDYSDKGNSSKNYLRILFQPGRAVQTRELNQMQSAIQDQIDKFGQHIFQDGSTVLDGEIDVDNKVQWIDVTLTANGALVAADTTRPLVGKKIYCRASGSGYDGADVSATIMDYELKSDNDYRFYLRYTSDTTNFAGGSRTFADFKTGEALSGGGITIASDAAIGNGTGAITSGYAFKMHNAKGIYFVKGYFVEAPEQTKYVDTTSSAPLETIEGSVGFLITEPIINATNDSTLYDNATGSPNFSAPGADRYTMQLTLVLISDNTDIDRTNNVVATTVLNTVDVLPIATESKPVIPVDTKYSRIGETLALRTFEESGDYALQPFQLDLREDFDTGFNNGRSDSGDKAKFTVTLEPSTAYVKGQRIEILNKQTSTQNKGRTTDKEEGIKIQATFGSYIEVDRIDFLPKLVNTETYTISNGVSTSGFAAGTLNIATCKIKGIEYTGKKYRLFVYDVAQHVDNTDSEPISSGRTIYGGTSSAENDGSNRFYGYLNAKSRGMNIEQTGENNNIFYLPYEVIKTLTPSGVTSTGIKIPVRDKLQNQSVSSNTLAFTITSAELYHDNPNEYIVVNESTGAPVAVTNVALSTTTSTLDTATLTLGLSSGNVDVTFSKRITGSAGTKTLKTDGSTTVGAAAYAIGDTIALSNSDIISITSINSAADGSGTDLADNFIMEDGATATTYGNGRLICIKALSSTAVNVAYRYLEHTTPGSFFSVDSYPLDDTGVGDLDRAELPFVDGAPASDFLDFRHTSHSDLDPNGIIEIGGIEFYLDRHDRIVLNTAGKFVYLEGNSIAGAPLEVPDDSMMLYELYIPPFTNSVQNIQIEYKNNKRYTMRDIGKLEKRVKSLEYYTSLSLLEQATSDKQIFDNTGDRFKNGILVDEFKGHGKSDTRDPGFAIAVDPEEGVLRPSFTSQDLGIRNTATNLTTDATFGSTPKTGAANDPAGEDLIRLPVTSVRTLINQDKAAVAVSVNPFDVASWVGKVRLSPSSDHWKDTRRRPDVIIKQDGNVDALLNVMNEQLASQGTRWNDWNTTWSGKVTKTNLGEITGAQAVARGLGTTTPGFWPTAATRSWRLRSNRRWRWTPASTNFPTFNGGTVSTTNLRRARVQIEQKAEKGTMTRTGIRQFAEEGPPITQSLGDKIVDVSFVPFIRSRRVYFFGSGFKPNTTLYPFFDGVNISSYATGNSSYTRRRWRNNITRRDRFNSRPTSEGGSITSSAIVSDSRGRVSGDFIIPNQRRLRFKTGEREFRLIDNTSNDLSISTTYAMATYTARGIVNTLQETIISTRTVKVSERRVKESKSVTRTEEAVKAIRHVDPLAQTFVVDPDQYPAGVFVKDVDLFFRQKHNALPVRIQLVPCENGIPTQNVIPFSEVEKEFDEVNVSTTAATATTFTFESLVHLKGGVEYAIVVLSNSPEYFLWHSEVGKDDVTTGKRITKNPYTGVALKSANASTWTPDQNKDFKFHLRYAKFNESELSTSSPYSRTVGNSSTHTAYGDFVTISPENVYDAALSSSNQLRIDSINLIAESVVLPETEIRYFLKVKSQANVTTTYQIEPNEVLELGETIKYDDPTQLQLYCELSTGNEFLTPTIDLDRLSLLTFANTINGGANLTGETGATHGTAKARYITNMVRLDSAASRVDCYLDVQRPAPQANVEAYIRFTRGGTFTKLDSVEIPVAGGFNEVHFRTPDSAAAAEYNFDLFQIKLVLSTHTAGNITGDDSAIIPRCMNFRAIATA
tara:strand:+ start:2529 stop:7757 length:5229 start_codon:yes stop_codon:yes gene_type:complete